MYAAIALAWASLMTPFHDGMLITPGFLLTMLPSLEDLRDLRGRAELLVVGAELRC